MRNWTSFPVKAVLLVVSLGLAACTDPGRLGGGFGGDGVGNNSLGSPSDPTTPAYFNQVVGDLNIYGYFV